MKCDDTSSVETEKETEFEEPYAELRCYHVRLFDHGSRHARNLYDVDGDLLTDENGCKLNVWTQTMNEYFLSGRLRLIHHLAEPGYSYFITSDEQRRRFEFERENGSGKRMIYHVYADEDIDWRCPDCRRIFINPKK
jgi:hypothetical protein